MNGIPDVSPKSKQDIQIFLDNEDMTSLDTIAQYGPHCIHECEGFGALKAIARRNLEAAVAELSISGTYIHMYIDTYIAESDC